MLARSRFHPLVLLALGAGLLLTLGAIGSASEPEAPAPETSFSPERTALDVRFAGEPIPYRVMAVFVMPGATADLSLAASPSETSGGRVTVDAAAGALTETARHAWQWTAPDVPGVYPIRVRDRASGATTRLNAFVLTPFDHDRPSLNGFRIGQYEPEPRKGLAVYEPPQGFIELTPETADVRVSPHFTLGQFRCKQTGGPPAYLLLRTPMLRKLELILEAVNARGHAAATLHVMSGFRTPYYNRAIGNTTSYSRHLYGGAADVFVDTNGDEMMDDLTGDGQSTKADAHELARIVEQLMRQPDRRDLVGGLSAYGANAAHGPFVHVDARGYRARW